MSDIKLTDRDEGENQEEKRKKLSIEDIFSLMQKFDIDEYQTTTQQTGPRNNPTVTSNTLIKRRSAEITKEKNLQLHKKRELEIEENKKVSNVSEQ